MITRFRAWNKKTQSFIDYGDLVLDLRSGKIYAGDIGLVESTIDVTDQIELMQSTGLKDKNGVEIFEGDVVSVSVRNGFDYLDNKVCIVKNSIDYSGLVCATVDEDLEYQIFNTELFEEYTYEVIGNIYENSELLEEQ
ncbi:TPA: DNA-packaging protein [Enterococcus faecium]|nr:DNA-packaging protein [Enterococcus faecium]HAQ4319707.1 DNA-packaging protein [Enterococcus faecium]HAQ5011667.1 DNA-packaging protein [Enterococcus faecium]HAQ5051605.1 DNA-packaging protein [Enterococcus faecium]HAQ5074322.1 DNA-packaging protein [Enterococcus faecium]